MTALAIGAVGADAATAAAPEVPLVCCGAAIGGGAATVLGASVATAAALPVVPVVCCGAAIGAGPLPPGTESVVAITTNCPGPGAVQTSCSPATLQGISAFVAVLITSRLPAFPPAAASSAAEGVNVKVSGPLAVAGAVKVSAVLLGSTLPSGTVTLGDEAEVATFTPGTVLTAVPSAPDG